ncbi:JADE1, partial [Cordylochernes scorpioides]
MEQLTELTMELLIEEFEKECATKLQEQLWLEGGLEIDDNSVCDVCRVPDTEEGNEIVFCDACNVGVHQACYGILNIPAGSWVCRTCALGISPACQLCPNTKGAMKSTKPLQTLRCLFHPPSPSPAVKLFSQPMVVSRNGLKWAHVSCALWVPEVTIADPERMEPISKLAEIPVL